MVIFIDFSNDGYARQNRKKSSQEVNLRDADHAAERYAEVEAIVLGKKPRTQYYTEENGLCDSGYRIAKWQRLDLCPAPGDRYRAYGGGLPENCGGLSGVEGFPSN